jgi:NADH:ubiquinone oxidoreductase subunit K
MTAVRVALLVLAVLWAVSAVLIVQLFRRMADLDIDDVDELELRRRARIVAAFNKEARS